MSSSQITAHLEQFLSRHPKGTASDFANYLKVIQEIAEL